MVRISEKAIAEAIGLGLHYVCDDVRGLLRGFAKDAAIVTHPRGNRRYGGYVLEVDENVVHGIAQFEPGYVCNDCHGVGFHRIVDRSKVHNVPCQSCSAQVCN